MKKKEMKILHCRWGNFISLRRFKLTVGRLFVERHIFKLWKKLKNHHYVSSGNSQDKEKEKCGNEHKQFSECACVCMCERASICSLIWFMSVWQWINYDSTIFGSWCVNIMKIMFVCPQLILWSLYRRIWIWTYRTQVFYCENSCLKLSRLWKRLSTFFSWRKRHWFIFNKKFASNLMMP